MLIEILITAANSLESKVSFITVPPSGMTPGSSDHAQGLSCLSPLFFHEKPWKLSLMVSTIHALSCDELLPGCSEMPPQHLLQPPTASCRTCYLLRNFSVPRELRFISYSKFLLHIVNILLLPAFLALSSIGFKYRVFLMLCPKILSFWSLLSA